MPWLTPRRFAPEVPDPVVTVMMKMMAKEPKDRYQDAMDLIRDLRATSQLLEIPLPDEPNDPKRPSVAKPSGDGNSSGRRRWHFSCWRCWHSTSVTGVRAEPSGTQFTTPMLANSETSRLPYRPQQAAVCPRLSQPRPPASSKWPPTLTCGKRSSGHARAMCYFCRAPSNRISLAELGPVRIDKRSRSEARLVPPVV